MLAYPIPESMIVGALVDLEGAILPFFEFKIGWSEGFWIFWSG
jgi:hydrogenase/urease accessory protein HupE